MVRVKNKFELVDALLEYLLNFDKPVRIEYIYAHFPEYCGFPESWHRMIPQGKGYNMMEDLGIEDAGHVSESEIPSHVPTESYWKRELREARGRLKKNGWIDDSTARGTWMLKIDVRAHMLRERQESRSGSSDGFRKRLHQMIDEQDISFVDKVYRYAKGLVDNGNEGS